MKKILFILTISLLSTIWCFPQHTVTIDHTYYTLEFDTVLKSPLISWYVQTTAHATAKTKIDRKTVATFHEDPLIPVRWQITTNQKYAAWNREHKDQRFDKGHLSPYTAFDFDLTAATESMYLQNTAPQYSFFNEHPWERLEQYILKTLAPQHDSIIVYTGCLYGDNKMGDVPIPDYYWKVIVYDGWEYAWLAPNEQTSNTDYTKYAIDVDKLSEKIHSYYPKLKLYF